LQLAKRSRSWKSGGEPPFDQKKDELRSTKVRWTSCESESGEGKGPQVRSEYLEAKNLEKLPVGESVKNGAIDAGKKMEVGRP